MSYISKLGLAAVALAYSAGLGCANNDSTIESLMKKNERLAVSNASYAELLDSQERRIKHLREESRYFREESRHLRLHEELNMRERAHLEMLSAETLSGKIARALLFKDAGAQTKFFNYRYRGNDDGSGIIRGNYSITNRKLVSLSIGTVYVCAEWHSILERPPCLALIFTKEDDARFLMLGDDGLDDRVDESKTSSSFSEGQALYKQLLEEIVSIIDHVEEPGDVYPREEDY